MGILIAFGDRIDRDAIAADFSGNRRKVLGRRDHIEFRLRVRRRRRRQQCGQQPSGITVRHKCHLRRGARRAPRLRTETGTEARSRQDRWRSSCAGTARVSGRTRSASRSGPLTRPCRTAMHHRHDPIDRSGHQ